MIRAIIIAAIVLSFSGQVYAHSGRTDKDGGHNCSEKSKKKGLCTGYHYHKRGKQFVVHADEPAVQPEVSKEAPAE